ncbi:MAG: hypothetical protein ABSH20_10135 [Tepidisphaeraceae bacterium]
MGEAGRVPLNTKLVKETGRVATVGRSNIRGEICVDRVSGVRIWRACSQWGASGLIPLSQESWRPAGCQWGILDPKHTGDAKPAADLLETKVKLPPGEWGDQALGPDGNIYLTPKFDPGLAYVVAAPDGKVLLRRGADFDRLTVALPEPRLAAGVATPFKATVIRSRDIGYVPASEQLIEDNRPALKLRAFLAPASSDPLALRVWKECPLAASPADAAGTEGTPYTLAVPADCFGRYDLRLTATPSIPGATPLEVQTAVSVQPQNARAFLSVKTDRGRTGFAAGQSIRISVAVEASADVDLTGAALDLFCDGKSIWSAPLGLATVSAGRIGQPNGTLRIMKGGGQIGGLAAPSGGILSVAISTDAS